MYVCGFCDGDSDGSACDRTLEVIALTTVYTFESHSIYVAIHYVSFVLPLVFCKSCVCVSFIHFCFITMVFHFFFSHFLLVHFQNITNEMKYKQENARHCQYGIYCCGNVAQLNSMLYAYVIMHVYVRACLFECVCLQNFQCTPIITVP